MKLLEQVIMGAYFRNKFIYRVLCNLFFVPVRWLLPAFYIIMLSELSSCISSPKPNDVAKAVPVQGISKLDNTKVKGGGLTQKDSQKLTDTAPDELSDTLALDGYKEAIAPFKIRLVDGKGYTFKDLSKNKQTVLVYFQPDCPECQAFTEALTKRLPGLLDKQFVMISFTDIKQIRSFDDKYHLSGHPNMKIGSEGYTFVVQKYYQIEHFPFVCCYDNDGKLYRVINPSLDPSSIAALL